MNSLAESHGGLASTSATEMVEIKISHIGIEETLHVDLLSTPMFACLNMN